MNGRRQWLAGLAVALFVAGVLSWFASSSPDGLEWAAEQLGFAHHAEDSATAGSPLADYGVAGVGGWLSTALAGVAGTLLVLALTTGLAWVVRGRAGVTR